MHAIGGDNMSSNSSDTAYSSSTCEDAPASSSISSASASLGVSVKEEPELTILSTNTRRHVPVEELSVSSKVTTAHFSTFDDIQGIANDGCVQSEFSQNKELASLHASAGDGCVFAEKRARPLQSQPVFGVNVEQPLITGLSQYHLSTLQIEREKIKILRSALRYLRDISYDLNQLNAGLSQRKRHRQGTNVRRSSFKRRRVQIKPKFETDSTDFEC